MTKNLFLGIDLGGKHKKTTGVFILKETNQKELEVIFKERVFGRELFKKIEKFLDATSVIAIDSPLTKGRGKGKMRLFEKFLSQKIFQKNRVSPIPPALMPKLCDFAQETKKDLEKNGFVLDINLIEVFPTFLKAILNLQKVSQIIKIKRTIFSNEDEEMAFYCALLGCWHSKLKTRYLGYKDGFLFLPEFSLWKKEWIKKFLKAWKQRDRLKYRYLITNLFQKTS